MALRLAFLVLAAAATFTWALVGYAWCAGWFSILSYVFGSWIVVGHGPSGDLGYWVIVTHKFTPECAYLANYTLNQTSSAPSCWQVGLS